MKTRLLLFIFTSLPILSFTQIDIYKLMFDSLKTITYQTYLTPSGNDNGSYGDGISYAMEGVLRMFENTQELSYIEDFVYISHEVLKHRDDHRGIDRKLPVWSTRQRLNNCYGPITHQTALILIPFAHYCYLSEKNNKQQFSELYFDQEFITFDGVYIRNLYEYSVWLDFKMMETVEYYDKFYWHKDSCMIQYADDNCETRYNIEGTDRQMNWGYLYLYLALKNGGTEKGAFYLNKYEQIICLYKSILQEKRTRSKISYYMWPESGWATYQNGKYEDISHAGASIDLVQFSYIHKNFIQQYSQNRCATTTFFSELDLQKFANTFTNNIYHSPLKFHNAIDGSCYFWRYPKDCENYDFLLDYGVARWLSLSKKMVHPQLTDAQSYYYMISDYYTSYLYKPDKFFTGSMGTNLVGLANASKYKHQFSPVGMIELDSLNIDLQYTTIYNGHLKSLNENQFSLIFFQDKINNQEIKFEIRPNSLSKKHSNQQVNFKNIGFEIKESPLTLDEIEYLTLNKPYIKLKNPKLNFYGYFFGDTTLQRIEIQDNKMLLKSDIKSNKPFDFTFTLPPSNYLFTMGDFNNDKKDEIVVFDKNSGLFQLYNWNATQQSLMIITNCKLPQDQYIEYINSVYWNGKTYLVVYRAADRMICIYEITF